VTLSAAFLNIDGVNVETQAYGGSVAVAYTTHNSRESALHGLEELRIAALTVGPLKVCSQDIGRGHAHSSVCIDDLFTNRDVQP
jgi:hypothetical protein